VWSIIATAALLPWRRRCCWRPGSSVARQDGADRVLRHRARWQLLPMGELFWFFRAPGGLHHGAAALALSARYSQCSPKAAFRVPNRRSWNDRRGPPVFFVWQHHLFQSGINRTCGLVHVDDGAHLDSDRFIFLVGMGTMYKAKIRYEVRCSLHAVYFNFLIGGHLGRVPLRRTSERDGARRFFVLSHFHYTIMGGLIFASSLVCTSGYPR